MKYRVLAAGVLAASLVAYTPSSFAETKKFTDVPNWAVDAVDYLVGKNVISGMPDGTFGANDPLDRAQAATMMTKIMGIEVNQSAKPSFTDAQAHWGTPYIAAVEKAGIMQGKGNGVFDPSGKVTRAELAAILVNAYHLESFVNGTPTTKFEDLKGTWGEKYANILVALNISIGTDNGWQPDRVITRAEAAQLIAKTDQSYNKPEENNKTITIDRSFLVYNDASLSSGIAAEFGPQNVVVKEERDGWVKIGTYLGDKWLLLEEKKMYMGTNFITYKDASHSSARLGKYSPQYVTIVEEKGDWIRIRTGSGFQWLDLTHPNGVNFLEGKSIVIDPGHGGPDPGKVHNDLVEKEIVLDVSLQVRQLFEQRTPFNVLLTRETDMRPGVDASDSLVKRVEFAEKNKADIYVSVHANASGVGGHGTETFYYEPSAKAATVRSAAPSSGTTTQSVEPRMAAPSPQDSKVLAEKIQARLVTALGTRDRGEKVGNHLYVIRKTTMPAVLTELAFVDQEDDAKILDSPYYRKRAAEAIYMGILDYYEWKGNNVSSYRL
ncbi:amidase [Bacillus manliponensis]|uniref:Amidase n=1 Tax=Bacillus manliponensis TaxID=574376 RepID=A0A073KA41_9BACI|nr:N-acetylmuramoyl-L-alanine amidase [Bacillus manliponensis]KEK19153.1 amidase [Bacillus manliponensis]